MRCVEGVVRRVLFYAWGDQSPSVVRSMESAVTTEGIRQHHADSDSTYGMPHVMRIGSKQATASAVSA